MFSGIQPTTLIDFPGRVATILFTAGCNFRCPYCYNKGLVVEEESSVIDEVEIFSLLAKRQKFIDGVVITGGEPLLHYPKLKEFLQEVRQCYPTFEIKLDTNGSFPERMEDLIQAGLVSYVAIDIKSSWEKYNFFTKVPNIKDKMAKSADILRKNGIAYEFRTTVMKPFFSKQDVKEIANFLKEGECYYLQKLQIMPELMVDWKKLEPYKNDLVYTKQEILELIGPLKEKGIRVQLRGSW